MLEISSHINLPLVCHVIVSVCRGAPVAQHVGYSIRLPGVQLSSLHRKQLPVQCEAELEAGVLRRQARSEEHRH
jgi:hypothetical protein